jgi:regulator of RNase E activity RraB
MSNTPRTDAAVHPTQILRRADGTFVEIVDVVTCRQLERELAEAQAEIVRLTKRKDECSNGWDGALATVQRLERELADAVAKERERCAKVCERKIDAPAGFYQIVMAAASKIRKGE